MLVKAVRPDCTPKGVRRRRTKAQRRVLWAGGGHLGGIQEAARKSAMKKEHVCFEYAQMHREGFLAEEITHTEVWRQEHATCGQEAELGGQ